MKKKRNFKAVSEIIAAIHNKYVDDILRESAVDIDWGYGFLGGAREVLERGGLMLCHIEVDAVERHLASSHKEHALAVERESLRNKISAFNNSVDGKENG